MLKAPNWAPHAVPTVRGWVNPVSGELLKSQTISQSAIDEWHTGEPSRQLLTEVPKHNIVEDPVESGYPKTKALLEEYARRNYGIELDCRMTYQNMISDLESKL